MSARRITVRIDRIIVESGRPSRAALAAAIERELKRLLAAPGAIEDLRGAGATEMLDGGVVNPRGRGDAALGRAVASATMGVLRR
jgi:hypothetical protein